MRVAIQQLSLAYGRKLVLSDINGVLERGQTIALTGCNGSGKSTLLRTLAGRSKPAGGSISFEDLKPSDIGYLPQSAALNRDVPLSVFDYCASGLFAKIGPFAAVSSEGRASVSAALERVGLSDHAKALIHEISGGQFQRLAFARVMVQDPKLILLDEPFAALDAAISENLMGVIADWASHDRCVVAALHHGAMIPRFLRQLNLDHGIPQWVGEDVTDAQDHGHHAKRLRLVTGLGTGEVSA